MAHYLASARRHTPQRWKGLKEPMIGRPKAARRMPGIDALDYIQLRISKSSNAYVVPHLRNQDTHSPTLIDCQPPLKRARLQEEEPKETGSAKRPRDEDDNYINVASGSPLSSDDQPDLKRVCFNEELNLFAAEDDAATDTERRGSASVQGSVGETETTTEQPETTATYYVPVDSTLLNFDSLVFLRLKELWQEQGGVVAKGTKKVDLVLLLSDKYPSPRGILEKEPYTSFTKEALEVKCRDLGISDSGSKAKLVERLEDCSEDF